MAAENRTLPRRDFPDGLLRSLFRCLQTQDVSALTGSRPGRPVLEGVIGRQMTERHRRAVRSVSSLQRTQGTLVGEGDFAAGGAVPVEECPEARYHDQRVDPT